MHYELQLSCEQAHAVLGEQGARVSTYTEVPYIDHKLVGKQRMLKAATCLDCLQHVHRHVHSDLISKG